jgi:uncharacterized membrane protein YfcA
MFIEASNSLYESLARGAVIFGAAFAAGMVNSVAGGGTLISFPTLVWLGRNPILANTTNAVALWPGALAGCSATAAN